MKKFITSFIALILIFGASITFSACEKIELQIGFDKGVYSCAVDENSFEINENLSEQEINEFLEFDQSESMEKVKEFDKEYFNNSFIKINKRSVTLYLYENDYNVFCQQAITIKKFTFKKNVLTLSFDELTDFKITENADKTLTLCTSVKYDFSEEIGESNFKTVYNLEITLTPSTTENPVNLPTPKSVLYPTKIVEKKYVFSSVSNVEDLFNEYSEDLVEFGITNASEYAFYLNNNSKGEIILLSGGYLYYEVYIDIMDMMLEDEDESSLSYDQKIGYLYQYEESSVEGTFDVSDDTGIEFSYKLTNNGNNIAVTVEDVSGYSYTINFINVATIQ